MPEKAAAVTRPRIVRPGRPTIGSGPLCAAAAAYLLLLTNFTFWCKGLTLFEGHEGQLLALAAALLALHVATLMSVSGKFVLKPILISLVMAAAASSYFVDTFGIVLDEGMVRNVVETAPREAAGFATAGLAWHLLLFGVLPSALIAWVKIAHRPILSKLAHNTPVILGCLAVAIAVVAANYASYASVFREHHEFLGTLNPAAGIAAAVDYAEDAVQQSNIEAAPLGTDARKGPLISAAPKPVLTVLVMGETARARNFSLDGYGRETNPELARRDIINFPNATSCGTATAVSLPCMFSVYTREEFSDYKARATQNLTDVLRYAGIDVEWWDNNTGHKGIAARIPNVSFENMRDPAFCGSSGCYDGVLLDRLRKRLETLTEDAVLVLHQNGSHGPAYFERYPEEFETFRPACRTAEFADCTQQEIVNAYDNTILYTDHMLAETIDLLARYADRFDSAMIYVSDHGESLGENGIYLHAAPYFIAPEVQTRVPFLVWLSDGLSRAMHLDQACLNEAAGKEVSHDNLFHSVLGLMNVETSVYQPSLDIFAACHGPMS